MSPFAAADGVKDNKLAQNPEVGDTSPILCRHLRGSNEQYLAITPGFTDGHRCLVPSELRFTTNSSCRFSGKNPADQKE